jgi:glucose/arabinose dehydrogenase
MNRLIRGRIRDGQWVDEQVLWQADIAHYTPFTDVAAGGRIAFDPDGFVFFSVGMKSMDGIQDLASPHGKIHRLHDDGRVPADNPFVDVPGADKTVWTYGHRSPQGLEFDPVSRRLWGTEHGPRGGDEVNLLLPGRNYGWPLHSLGQNYDGTKVAWGKAQGVEIELEDIEQPVVDLTPSPAVSIFVIYDGESFPGWRGDFVVGSLKAADVYRMRFAEGRLVAREMLIENLARIRDLEVGPAGELYLLLEHASGGQVVRVVPAAAQSH